MPTEKDTYTFPFRNINRVIPRGMWEDRLLPGVGMQAVNLEGLARKVIFLAVACSHDDQLLDTQVVGYRVALGESEIWEYNFPDAEEWPVVPGQSTVGLITENGQKVIFSIDTQRDGDIVLYRLDVTAQS